MTEASQDLIPLLTEELQERAARGEVIVSQGKNPNKPVVRDAVTGTIVKGSGRPPKANDIGLISKKTAYKRTRTYNEWFNSFIPATKQENPEALTSLEELIEAAAQVARGWNSYTDTRCPECEHKFTVETVKPPDAKVLTFLIERAVGKAKETTEINIRSEQLIQMLHDDSHIVEVIDITPEQRAERMLAVRNFDPNVSS